MKKTLIAMAALAAVGVVQAQVSLTGTFASGYKTTSSSGKNAYTLGANLGGATLARVNGSDAAGLGVDTSEIDISAKEDLGGGQTIVAAMALAGADRSGESGNGNVTGRDATLTYTNMSFGQIQMGSTQGAAVHSGIPTADAPVIDMDGKLFQIKSNSDFISYAAPIGPVVFQYKQSESSAGIGLGQGSIGDGGVKVGQRTSDFALVYASGPLTVVGAYRSYDNRNALTITSADGLTKDQVYAVQLGYNLGSAKLGFGYNVTSATVGAKVQDMLVAFSMPVGNWTLGATYAMATTSGVADANASVFPGTTAGQQADFKAAMQRADGVASGYSLGAKYSLSKRTAVTIKYASWERSGYEQFEAWGAKAAAGTVAAINALNEFGYAGRNSETSVLLSHSF